MNKVLSLPATTTFTPEQALHSALSLDMQDVLIIGYDQEGEMVIRSSRISRMDALWLLEQGKKWALVEESE